MKKTILASLCIIMLLLSACGTQKPQLEGRLLNFNLGESTVKDGSGESVPYQIQGVLGIPDTKNAPIVVLIHGAHPISNAAEDRYDVGFNYLAQSLSDKGNLVMSMNVGINFSFEKGEPSGNERSIQIITEQLSLLRKAINGDKSVFNYDLTGKGDFNKLVIMGHSRSGLDVLEWAAKAPDDIKVAGVVSVAPSAYKETETSIPDVPIGIIIPQLDGDVISLDGNDYYESIVSDKNRLQSAELIYLKNANHGHFNTQLTKPDLSSTEEQIAQMMPAEKQRQFLVDYLADFIKSTTEKHETVFASASELKTRAYDCDVLLRVHSQNTTSVYSSENSVKLTTGENTVAAQKIASYFPDQNTVETFKMPGASAFEHYALDNITWTGNTGKVTIPVNADLTKARFIDIDMAVDSTDLRNKSGQAMTVSFADSDRKQSSVALDKTAGVLLWQEGELVEMKGWDEKMTKEYTTFTPLVTLRIPVQQLEGVDLSRVVNLTLSWTSASGGSVMLRSVSRIQ